MYITVQEADTYFGTLLNRDLWFDEENTTYESGELNRKEKALHSATQIIDSLRYKGTPDQTDHAFPRNNTPTPDAVRYACAEIAYSLLDDVDPDFEYQALNMTSQAYSNIRSAYDRSNPPAHILAGVPSLVAWRYLLPFILFDDGVRLNRVS